MCLFIGPCVEDWDRRGTWLEAFSLSLSLSPWTPLSLLLDVSLPLLHICQPISLKQFLHHFLSLTEQSHTFTRLSPLRVGLAKLQTSMRKSTETWHDTSERSLTPKLDPGRYRLGYTCEFVIYLMSTRVYYSYLSYIDFFICEFDIGYKLQCWLQTSNVIGELLK